jgi:hypothetical protein
MRRRLTTGIASAALVLAAVAAPTAAAGAAEPRDDDSGIVVGVEIAPRPGCSPHCGSGTAPGSVPGSEPGWQLADTGADVEPALVIALALGASGLVVAGAAGVARARSGRAEN